MLKIVATLVAATSLAAVNSPAAARTFAEVLHVVPAPNQPACTVGWKPTGIIANATNVAAQARYEFIANGRPALRGVKLVPAHGQVQIPGFPLVAPPHAARWTGWEILYVQTDGTQSNRIVVTC